MGVGPEAPRRLPEAQHHVLALEALQLLRIFVLLAGLVQLFDLLLDRGGFLDFGASASAFSASVSGTSSFGFLAAVLGLAATALPAFLAFPAAGLLPEPLRAPVVGRRAFGHIDPDRFVASQPQPIAMGRRVAFQQSRHTTSARVSMRRFGRSVWRFAVARRIRVNFIRLYVRVLAMLGAEARLGWILAGANLLLAGALFVEPMLFGRIIDTLAAANPTYQATRLEQLDPAVRRLGRVRACLPSSAGTLIALHADRLAHRRYQAVRDRLLRARPATAAQLSQRRPFRPAGEGDGHRHQYAVEPVARVLPRALRQLRLAVRAAAAHAFPQLALSAFS